ncbi:MAG: threonylcarbamoyl-AMP synthase [Phycisphaerales bacterium]|nr:threonylcarbamoyl-AMP synthase [Phycisphaerales bacterium]
MPGERGQLDEAVRRLRNGEPIGFPTETVYGLGAPAFDAGAVRLVFEMKGRPANNPLIVHVSDEAMARRAVSDWPESAERLSGAFWPGPLSIIVPRAPALPPEVTAGGETVCVRCPAHPVALALIEALDEPLVGPSANRSGHVSPTTPDHVRAEFPGLFVLDGGPCRIGIESTVVRVGDERVEVLRRGAVAPGQIEGVLGRPVEVSQVTITPGAISSSPGLLERHYAPRTPTVLVEVGDLPRVTGEARTSVVLAQEPGETASRSVGAWIRMPRDAESYAASLYDALRRADSMRMDRIVVVRPHGTGDAALWAAIEDRLRRASAPDHP